MALKPLNHHATLAPPCAGAKHVLTLDWQSTADMLKRQDREGGRTRHWRSNFKRLQRELLQLEEDEQLLDSVFPQVGFIYAAADKAAQQRILLRQEQHATLEILGHFQPARTWAASRACTQ